MRVLIARHVDAADAEVGRLEGVGAVNFLDLDEISVADEGEPVDPPSVVSLAFVEGRPELLQFERSASDPFLSTMPRRAPGRL